MVGDKRFYHDVSKEEIVLWCDARSDDDDDAGNRRKRKKDGEKRQEREEEVDDVFRQLKRKHGEKFDIPRLQLWARTICGNLL